MGGAGGIIRRSIGVMSILAALQGAPMAGAAEKVDEVMAEAGGLEEVTVTARRRAERQQDVPIAITALSDDFLKRNAIVNLTDLNGKVPALTIDNFNSISYTNIGIRANRSANVAPGQDSAVGYYFNEVNFAFPVGINLQMFDLQAAEILKGPQGTLFGRNTTGGAVLLSSVRPGEHFEGSTAVDLTYFDGRSGATGTAVLNVPVSDAVAFRFAAQAVRRDGYVRNLANAQQIGSYEIQPFTGQASGKPMNNDNRTAWRASMLWQPAAGVENLLTYQGSRLRTRGMAYSLTAVNAAGFANLATGGAAVATFNRRQAQQADDFWTTEVGGHAFNELDDHAVMNTTTWQLSDSLLLKNVAGWRRFDLHDMISISGMPYQVLDAAINDMGHEWSEELQLQGQNGSIDWVAGLFYSRQHIEHPNSTLALPQFGAPPSDNGSLARNQSRAVFAQGTWKIPALAGLGLTAGVRQTKDTREMSAYKFASSTRTTCTLANAAGVRLPPGACLLEGSTDYSRVTYNLTVDYKLDADTLVYLAHRKGYRAGGFNYTPDNPQTFGPFDPEDVKDWEVGLKRDWKLGDAVLRTNLAVYSQDYAGIQRFSSPVTNPSSFSVINAADASIDGGELEVTFLPVRGLELSAYYSHIKADFKEFVTGAGNFSDNEFAQVPKHQYSMRARYTLPLPGTVGKVSLQADYSHRSEVFFVDTAEGPNDGPRASLGQDGFGLLNLRADWEGAFSPSLDLSFYVKNATAEEYNTFGILLYNSLGYNIGLIGEPRVYGLQGTFRF